MAETTSKRLKVTFDNGHCAGHFPGHAIVPAAVQAQWLISLASDISPETSGWKIRQLKLLRELQPGRDVDISLAPTKLGFKGEVSDADGPYAQISLVRHD